MPEIRLDDTIAAIATPPGEGGIGVVRVSGPKATNISNEMFVAGSRGQTPFSQVPARKRGLTPLVATFGTILDAQQIPIDQVILTFFKNPKSYTGEDVVEISAHGGSRVLERILARTVELGARHAEPGEFTRRAFLNGKLDLTQAEAVCDLIRARTDKSVDVAMKQLAGKLSGELQAIKSSLMRVYAHLEAYLDFPDDHLEVYGNQELLTQMNGVAEKLKSLIASFSKGELLREGALVVIVGRPNVGKSSLMNAFLDRDRAIVSDIAGTTRDILEESVDLDGLWVRLVDTAGLRHSEDPLDQAGMERTKRYLNEGDLFLWLTDGNVGLTKQDQEILEELRGNKLIAVVNKVDLPDQADAGPLRKLANGNPTAFVSCKTKEGISDLEKQIERVVLEDELAQESVLVTRLRHKQALEESLFALEKSLKTLSDKESLEFVTLDLKRSVDALREMVGEVYSEDLLDAIFREFCIGK